MIKNYVRVRPSRQKHIRSLLGTTLYYDIN